MEDRKSRKPERPFLLVALLVALYTTWAVHNGAVDEPEFVMLLPLAFPITLPALIAVLVTMGIAISRTFRAPAKDPVFVAWSVVTVVYVFFVFLAVDRGIASGFTAVTVSFLYAAIAAMNVVLARTLASQTIRMALLVVSLAAASVGLFLWDEQQQRFRFPKDLSAESEALLLAAYKGETAEVERLLDEGADIDAVDEAGWDALYGAVWRGHVDTARVLLERGANPNSRENKGGSFCFDWNCTEKIYLEGSPAIVAAAKRRHNDLVQLLLDYGATAHTANEFCESPMIVAASRGDAALLQLLLNAGVDPNRKVDSCSQLPMVVAADRGHADVVRLLLRNNADPNAGSGNRIAPLHAAAQAGNADLVSELLRYGADPNAKDFNGRTPLMWALGLPHRRVSPTKLSRINQIVSQLLDAGADVNAADGPNKTPMHETALMKAARSGLPPTVRILLEAGAKVGLQNSAGRTALMFAAMNGDTESIELLLNAGANTALRDVTDKTARDWALAEGHDEAASLLDKVVPDSDERVPE